MSIKIKKIIGLIVIAVLLIIFILLSIKLKSTYSTYIYEKTVTPTPMQKMYSVNKDLAITIAPEPNTTPEPTPILIRSGNAGENVKEIQLKLMELGFYSGEIDGQFGPSTKNSVMWFQSQHNLASDGIVGSESYKVLFGKNAKKAIPTPSPSPTPDPNKAAETNPENYLLLVNRDNSLGKDYTPKNLVLIDDILDSNIVKAKYSETKADYTATLALNDMLSDAYNNYNLENWQISSAYRSYNAQKRIFNKKTEEYMKKNNATRSKAINAIKLTVAEPGTSEHQTGFAFDITIPGKFFKDTMHSKWIEEHCHEYGFIVRYKANKEKITGFIAEPWHIRYVGKKYASIIYNSDLALEEFIANYGELN